MSYEISYRRQAFLLPIAQTGYYDDVLFLVEECGSNNCWEMDNKRRARSWACLAVGSGSACLAEVTRCAASCCGGSLILCGRRHTTPEAYIRAWRKTIKEAAAFDEARRMGFRLHLFARMTDAEIAKESRYAFERLSQQNVIAPQHIRDEITGAAHTEWHFDEMVPEQVKLWLETRASGRGFRSVDVRGPER